MKDHAFLTVVNVMTFDELVEHGRQSGCQLIGDKRMPRWLDVWDSPAAYEDDDTYIVDDLFFHRGDFLTHDPRTMEVRVVKADEFARGYTEVADDPTRG